MTEHAKESATSQGVKDFIAGTGAGIVGKVAEYPLDTVKVRLQLVSKGTIAGVAKQIYRTQGVMGFYKGVASPIVGSAAENAVLFSSFGLMSRVMWGVDDGPMPMARVLLAGGISGIAVATILTPVELVKCRMQAQTDLKSVQKYKSTVDCLVRTVREEVMFKGLFRGHTATLMREIPGNAAWFGAYHSFCRLMTPEGKTQKDLHPALVACAGALGGASYWTAFYPADVVKSNMQTGQLPPGVNSFGAAFKHIHKEHGFVGLYRGLGVTLLRAVPSNALIFSTYEMLNRLMHKF